MARERGRGLKGRASGWIGRPSQARPSGVEAASWQMRSGTDAGPGGGAAASQTLGRRAGRTRLSTAPPPQAECNSAIWSKGRKETDMSKKVLGFTSRKWVAFWVGVALGVVFGGLAAC